MTNLESIEFIALIEGNEGAILLGDALITKLREALKYEYLRGRNYVETNEELVD